MEPGTGETRGDPGLGNAATGIRGLDEITRGGLPRGRTTLVTGGPGTGRTMFAMEFLVRGATRLGEPGVFASFGENPVEFSDNAASLGFCLPDLAADNLLYMDYVAGQTPKSVQAFANLKKICEEYLAETYRIEVIDLPGDQILAVPTLGRKLPPPIKKIIDGLSDTERVLVGLDVRQV